MKPAHLAGGAARTRRPWPRWPKGPRVWLGSSRRDGRCSGGGGCTHPILRTRSTGRPRHRHDGRWPTPICLRSRFTILDLVVFTGGNLDSVVDDALDLAAEAGRGSVRLVDRYAGFVFDLDGTVYLDDVLLPGAAVDTGCGAGAEGHPTSF